MAAYALTIFAGAFLLFQVQPLIGKYILPWFGGGPGVWTTCMLFFQVLLLGGYAYAHLSTRWLRPRTQSLAHLVLLLAALALLPIVPAESWKPHGEGSPTWRILLLLTATLGLPYLVLSATGPLLQAWFCRTHPHASPYRLYALSNLGSLLALLSYPFYFETHFSRKTQAALWGWGLVGYVLCCGFCALRLWRPVGNQIEETFHSPEPTPATGTEGGCVASPPLLHRLLWLLLPACASVLLLAATNKLCLDVAVFPFLWMLPLALYLVSFIICFDSPRWYRRLPFTVALVAAAAGLCWALWHGSDWPLWKQAAVYGAGLFICCMVCHGELYRLKPEPGRLTGFYLMIAAGGALGGGFVALIAPWLFKDYYELHWGLFGCGLLFALVCTTSPWRAARNWRTLACTWLWLGLAALGVVLWLHAHQANSEVIASSRNFYGVLTVYEHRKAEPEAHHFLLQHGRITHGLQFADPQQASWPTSYYGEQSGVGLALNALPAGQRRIGLIGLGTGTLASYAKPGDYLRIYEINPQIQRLALSPFSYLRRCAGQAEVVLGDARLSMEQEPPQNLDLLVLDAFSSDAIPVHLLTREAFEGYQRHLKTNAIVAVHISNHFLNLEPVVVNLARHFGYHMAIIDYDETEEDWWLYGSTWVLLTRDEHRLNSPEICAATKAPKATSTHLPLWTDDFASLFQILK